MVDFEKYNPLNTVERIDLLINDLVDNNVAITEKVAIEIAMHINKVKMQIYYKDKIKDYITEESEVKANTKKVLTFGATTEDVDLINEVIKAAGGIRPRISSSMKKILGNKIPERKVEKGYFSSTSSTSSINKYDDFNSHIIYSEDEIKRNGEMKYRPGKARRKDIEGPRKKIIYIPMGGKTK